MKRAFRSQIVEAEGNLLAKEDTVITRFSCKSFQFDFLGPAQTFLRLVRMVSVVIILVIIIWKILS